MERLNINFRILFIDKNIFNREIQSNKNINANNSEMFTLSTLNTNFEFKNQNNRNLQNYNILLFGNEDKALDYLKQLKFIDVIIIVAEDLFNNFVKKFKNNLKDIYVIPRIIIFNRGRNTFSLSNISCKCCQKKEDEFYRYGGTVSSFDEIYNFIDNFKKQNIIQNNTIIQNNQLNQSIMREGNYLFEQIRKKEDLILPTFYKILLDVSETKNNPQFIQKIYMNYNNISDYNKLLRPIISMPSIPVELLSKYYARLYTIEGNFYINMKNSLLNADENNKEYMPYIKTLYEGVENGSLKTCIGQRLYSAASFSQDELIKLNEYKNNRILDLPMSIIFSKAFMSFSKNLNVAEDFLRGKNTLLIVEDAKAEYDLLTHADIEELSTYGYEKEVLFFPFSAFGIQDFEYDYYRNKYVIKLIYLGKYIKNFESDKKFNISSDKLPNSYFKNLLEKSGLVEKETIEKIKIKDISKKYKLYKENKNHPKKCCSKKLIIFLIIILIIGIGLGITLPLVLRKKKDDDNDDNKFIVCKAGSYYNSGSSICESCNEGYYSEEGSTSCTKCPEGQSSNKNSSSCFLCPPGTFSNNNYAKCTPCSAGYYNSEEGASECSKCPPGTFSEETGATSCTSCPPGSYSDGTNNKCSPCPAGTYYSDFGASECIKCPPGKYSEDGAISCIECSPGYYNSEKGASKCLRCSLGQSSHSGAEVCFNCSAGTYSNEELIFCEYCPKGHYSGVGFSKCLLCPEGTFADQEGMADCKICGNNYHSNDDRTGCIKDCYYIYLKQNWYIAFILILLNIF